MSITHLVQGCHLNVRSGVLINQDELAVWMDVLVYFILVVPRASVVVVHALEEPCLSSVGLCAVYPVVALLVLALPVVVVHHYVPGVADKVTAVWLASGLLQLVGFNVGLYLLEVEQ